MNCKKQFIKNINLSHQKNIIDCNQALTCNRNLELHRTENQRRKRIFF